MNNDQLAQIIRCISAAVDTPGSSKVLKEITEPLRAAGVVPSCHEGRGAEMDHTDAGYRMQLEWFAGQLLDMIDRESWGGINSWINCTVKFTVRKMG